MAKKKYYAVVNGRKTGIFESWDDCQRQVEGYSGAVFKGFPSLQDAQDFLENNGVSSGNSAVTRKQAEKLSSGDTSTCMAFTDGSFNADTGVYGFGGFLIDQNGEKHILQGCGDDLSMAEMRNVAGEILGALAAAKMAKDLGMDHLVIYHDYLGVAAWADGSWKANKAGTVWYRDEMRKNMEEVSIEFCHVKGHSGIDGNEEADSLAKGAVGVV